jgi:cytochrome c oxidase cbb3-type subunit 2
MPSYHWLADEKLDADDIQARMRVLRRLGDPYSDADIAAAPAAVEGKTRMDALVAYLQGLGIKNEPQPPAGAKPAAAGAAMGAP